MAPTGTLPALPQPQRRRVHRRLRRGPARPAGRRDQPAGRRRADRRADPGRRRVHHGARRAVHGVQGSPRRARHPVHLRRGADRLGPHRRELLGHPGARRHPRLHDVRQGPRPTGSRSAASSAAATCSTASAATASPPSAATRSPPPPPTPPSTTCSPTTCRPTRPPAATIIIDGLKAAASELKTVADVRGKGLMFAVDLADPATGKPAPALAAKAHGGDQAARPARRQGRPVRRRRCGWRRR